MKPILCAFILAATLAAHSGAHAEVSLLRVACEGDAARAEIAINGVFKGECPLDVQVDAGTVRLRAFKRIDASRERVFLDEFRIGEGVVKRVEVTLSAPRFNADAQRRENERLAAERATARQREEARQVALAEERRLDQEALQQQQKAVEAGDSAAMAALGDRYANGNGVAKSAAQAQAWYRKAAAAGNAVAAFKLSDLYKTGKKQDVAAILRMLELPMGQERSVTIEGEETIRAFVASDPFFEVPGGNQKVSYAYNVVYGANSATMHNSITCGRENRFFRVDSKSKSPDLDTTGEVFSALGGLIELDGKVDQGLFNSSRRELTRIEKLQGQPFPLTAGKRFGITYVANWGGTATANSLTCAIDGEVAKTSGQQIAGTGQTLICLSQFDSLQWLSRWWWHEPSGCFMTVRR